MAEAAELLGMSPDEPPEPGSSAGPRLLRDPTVAERARRAHVGPSDRVEEQRGWRGAGSSAAIWERAICAILSSRATRCADAL